MRKISFPKHVWDERLLRLLSTHTVYVPIENEVSSDYTRLNGQDPGGIPYNRPKPATPLKKFFLPVKENVTAFPSGKDPQVIVGVPSCDVMALEILDRIYLDPAFPDHAYKERRENTTIIATDCLSIQEHCHCNSYGVEPVGSGPADISLAVLDDRVLLRIHNEKGESLVSAMKLNDADQPSGKELDSLEKFHSRVAGQLKEKNRSLPDYENTGHLVAEAGGEVWKRYASTCVSCGACSAICPTCSCFLLIDRPGFQKVRNLDTCQYPGFERVAGGEDALGELPERFRNRYMCKYVWKPEQYGLKACTGCGRCIETCIGQISKNELFLELST